MVYRVYVEKKTGQTHEADSLIREVKEFLQIKTLLAIHQDVSLCPDKYDGIYSPNRSCQAHVIFRLIPYYL